MKNNPVNHSLHYNTGGIECIEAIKAALTEDEFVGFLKGQILKYTWRSGHKDDIIQDTKKSIRYAEYLCEFIADIRFKENLKALQNMPMTCDSVQESFTPDYFMITYRACWEVWGFKGDGKYVFFGTFDSYLEAREKIDPEKYRGFTVNIT